MPFSIVKTQGRQILKLEGAVTIRDAQDLAAKLGEGLEDGAPVAVDTGGLEDIDTCILQLLSSLRKVVPVLSFDNPSETFIGAVDRRGLRRELLNAREGP
ncbi:MAG: STAS domain-containing protein [Bryobacteraceae bacterium]|jgi:ABC-type transporter Mla MlaB component